MARRTLPDQATRAYCAYGTMGRVYNPVEDVNGIEVGSRACVLAELLFTHDQPCDLCHLAGAEQDEQHTLTQIEGQSTARSPVSSRH